MTATGRAEGCVQPAALIRGPDPVQEVADQLSSTQMMKETEHLLYPEISMADAVMRLPYDGLLASSAPSQAELEMWKRKTKTTTMSNQLIVGIIIGALRLIGKIEIYPCVFY